MAFRKVTLDRIPSQSEVLTISKSGLNFGAAFIKSNGLAAKDSMSFYFDDEDPYRLGFEFYDESGRPNSLSILGGSRGKTSDSRFVKAMELFSKSKILQSIQKNTLKTNRMFEIKKDKVSGIFYVDLRPCFEHRVSFDKRNSIDNDAAGIYRYLDHANKVVYIGKGAIKDRANSPDRRDWGVVAIEYSMILIDDEAYKWESFYLDAHIAENGALPVFNRISGKATT